jgi:hypothetical protein
LSPLSWLVTADVGGVQQPGEAARSVEMLPWLRADPRVALIVSLCFIAQSESLHLLVEPNYTARMDVPNRHSRRPLCAGSGSAKAELWEPNI